MRGWLSSPLRALGGIALLLVATALILSRIQSGDYLLNPDVAHPVAPLVHVAGDRHPAGGGKIYFVDVRIEQASKLEVFFHWLGFNSHSALVPASDFLPPGQSNKAFIRTSVRQMSQSEKTAAAVALRQLHYDVVATPNGVLVNALIGGTDAARKLQVGDRIVSLNGVSTPTRAKLFSAVGKLKPGQVATLRIERGARTRVIAIKTVDYNGRALIGFEPAQSAVIGKLPVKVSIDAGDIGGPSAGLSFTLEVMAQLGANVTHGYKVAATGEIQIDGTVSAIGGIEQKTYGVRAAGAQVFLVPVDGNNARDAERYAGPDLRIIPVTSVTQALHALAALPKLK